MYELEFNKWMSYKGLNSELLEELKTMKDSEKEDAFYKSLEFGTGGMRGIIGAGINRMNTYTIRKANYGFGKYLLLLYSDWYGNKILRKLEPATL